MFEASAVKATVLSGREDVPEKPLQWGEVRVQIKAALTQRNWAG